MSHDMCITQMHTNLASISDETGVGGAYCHVNHPMLAKFLDGCGHESLPHLQLSLAKDASHLTNERLTLVQAQLVVLVAMERDIRAAPISGLLTDLPQA